MCANKVRKGLRAVGRRNVRNTTVDKGNSQILCISPPSKTNGALNGGFRHGKRYRAEWQIQSGIIAEATIVFEYGSAAKLTLQATTIGRSYVQNASIFYGLFDGSYTLIQFDYVHVNSILNYAINVPSGDQELILSQRAWMRDHATAQIIHGTC